VTSLCDLLLTFTSLPKIFRFSDFRKFWAS